MAAEAPKAGGAGRGRGKGTFRAIARSQATNSKIIAQMSFTCRTSVTNALGMSRANRPPLVQKHHHRHLADHMREFGRVPVGEADAAVRLGLADRFRMRRAVDAIGGLGEVDPHGADRILRPLRYLNLLLGFDALEGEFRIIGIGGIEHGAPDPVGAAIRSSFADSGRPTMNLIRRLQRLWQLSSPETESISREEYDALLVFLEELDAEMKDMNGRVSDWIGVLIKSELLRRELER